MADKPACVEFTAPDQTSDGGVVLLKAVGNKMGLTERMATTVRNPPGAVNDGTRLTADHATTCACALGNECAVRCETLGVRLLFCDGAGGQELYRDKGDAIVMDVPPSCAVCRGNRSAAARSGSDLES